MTAISLVDVKVGVETISGSQQVTAPDERFARIGRETGE